MPDRVGGESVKLALWFALTVSLLSLSGQQAQIPDSAKITGPWPAPDPTAVLSMQHAAGNPPHCPVCRQPVDSVKPLTLIVEGDDDTAATLSLPVLVCPRDGVIFAVRP